MKKIFVVLMILISQFGFLGANAATNNSAVTIAAESIIEILNKQNTKVVSQFFTTFDKMIADATTRQDYQRLAILYEMKLIFDEKINITTAPDNIILEDDGTVNNGDFRDLKWGMTVTQVRNLELGGRFDEYDDGELSYEDVVIEGYNYDLDYGFRSSKLDYAFLELDGGKNRTIEDDIDAFNKIVSFYTSLYGNSTNSYFTPGYENASTWKKGLTSKTAKMQYTWETNSSKIDVIIFPEEENKKLLAEVFILAQEKGGTYKIENFDDDLRRFIENNN